MASDGLMVGSTVKDRDPRHPNRFGTITQLMKREVTVLWTRTNRETSLKRETFLTRFEVLP